MSEYQYYEFLAVDRPLSKDEQAQVRALSTRATITATRFVNEYHFGDFHGDTTKLVEQLYDAHLYFANWGSRCLLLRLPAGLLAKKTVEPYALEESLTVHTKGGYTLLDFSLDCEDGGEWDFESSFTLSDFVGLRAELAAGDLRPLYLAWLAGLRVWELAEDDEEEYARETEPPVPAGLGELTGPQQALAHFLKVDEDLLTVAADASAPSGDAAPADQAKALATFVSALPTAEKNALLVEAALGKAAHVGSRLMARFRATRTPADATTVGSRRSAAAPQRRSAAALLDAAHLHRTGRAEREQKARRAAEEARRRAAEERRAAHLAKVAAAPGPLWTEIDDLIGQKKPPSRRVSSWRRSVSAP
ncbi:hypothetical protein [Streptomyces sp. NPDC005181]|uniref:hypothetical protein n=1 Tax=Streptomyces sp. NPDC005181 TaxID=3156869 RepID=UPI0033B942D9